MYFTRSKGVVPPSNLILGGQELEWQEEARYLGVYLDTKLNFRGHIARKVKKAKLTLLRLRGSIAASYGVPPRT